MDDAPLLATPALQTVEYANSRTLLRPRSLKKAKQFLMITVAVPAIGVLILVAFYFTHWQWLPGVGMLFLPAGGVAALASMVAAGMQIIQQRPGEGDDRIRTTYIWALVAAIGSWPIAYGCMRVGTAEMDRPLVTVRVYNDTDRPIDVVSVLFDQNTIDVGPIAPHSSKRTWWNYHYHHSPGPVVMRVTASGRTAQRIDQAYCNDGRLKQEDLDIHVEPKELP